MWTISKQKLERQECWQQLGDKLLPEIGQVVDHKAHLLSQWATPKVKHLCKIEKQTVKHHNTLTAGAIWWITELAQRNGARKRNKPPVNKHSEKPTAKLDIWWTTELISRMWGHHSNLNSLAEGGADQAAATEREKKKTLPNHLVRLQQSFCLNTNTSTGCWRSNTRT
jgi:hypothetical protein